jgi:HlyD family secretion protein
LRTGCSFASCRALSVRRSNSISNAREDLLRGLTVGSKVEVARAGGREPIPALVTELLPLGSFATWQAERAIGDHDRSTLRLRLDPQADAGGFEPGMTVWILR